jgi:hypothetical protein
LSDDFTRVFFAEISSVAAACERYNPAEMPRAISHHEPISFLEPDGRLPGFAQRRLDALIAKKKSRGLTATEAKELREMLEYVDRKSIELLQRKTRVGKARS